MRTFSHLFGEHCTAEARRLWNNPDVFGDRPEQPQSSERQEIADVTVAPEGVRVRIDTAEEMEDSVQHEAIGRMERASKEEQRQAELQNAIQAEIEALVADIKDMSDAQRGEHVRKFNAEVLNPLGKTLSIIGGKPRISDYTPKGPEDPRILMKKMKIQQLSAEIHGLEQAMFNMRARGISRFGQEYIGFTKSMRRRGNVAPEIARAMRGEIAPQVKPVIDAWKNLGIQLSQKIAELEAVKLTPWQSMPLPAPAQAPAPAQPLREQSAPRFDRRVPVDRLEFSRSLGTLDPETQELIKSLSPEFQQSIGSIAPFLNEQEKNDLGSLTEKLANGEFNAKVSAELFNLDGTLRTPEEIRAEIASHPTEAKALEAIATFIESLSPGEKKVMEFLIKQAQQLNAGAEQNATSAEKIAKYKDAWTKAKESGDEPGMEMAEGLLMMNGMEIDEKGKLTPLEDGFGGRGMGTIVGFILFIDGFLKKIGEKMDRKAKKENKEKDEAPTQEMPIEKKNEEIQKSEKRIGELKKEQKDLKKKIDDGQAELDKDTDEETKPHLRNKLEDLKKELKKSEEELKEEEKKLEELKKMVPGATAEGKDSEKSDPILTKFATSKVRFVQEFQKDFEEQIQKMKLSAEAVKPMMESLRAYNEVMMKHLSIEKNIDGKYRIVFDIPSMATEVRSMPALQDFTITKEDLTNMQQKMNQGHPGLGIHSESGKILSNWVSADVVNEL